MFVLDQSLLIKLYDNLVPESKVTKGVESIDSLYYTAVNIDLSTTNHTIINKSLRVLNSAMMVRFL